MIQDYLISNDLRSKLKTHLANFDSKRVLILGDVGVDEYVMGEVRRISPEAPVPVVEVTGEDMRLGLAANVAQNIASLGGQPLLLSVVGPDQGAEFLRSLLSKQNIVTEYLITDPDRSTTRKTRVMAKHHHVVRVDYETRQFLSLASQKNLIARAEELIPNIDGIILQDYAKGVITPEVVTAIYKIAKKFNKPVLVDPHRINRAEFYAGCNLIKPNFEEAFALTGMDIDDLRHSPDRIKILGETLKARTGADQVVLTQGKEGMTIFNQSGSVVRVPTFAKSVFDVTGAGDTVISALALGTLSGLPLEDACVLANFAAGVVVAQVGCVPCTKAELLHAIDGFN